MKSNYFVVCAAIILLLILHGPSSAQQIQLSTPTTNVSDSFFENFGTGFGFSFGGGSGAGSRVVGLSPNGQLLPNVSFNQNNSVTPAFGGFDPNTGASFGIGSRSTDGGGFSLRINLSQGSTRSISSVSPSITLPNGGIGSLNSGRFSPFVTGIVPVTGNRIDNGVTRAIASGQLRPYDRRRGDSSKQRHRSNSTRSSDSSATSGDASVTEIKQQRLRDEETRIAHLEQFIQSAKAAEKEKDYAAVRRNIRRAVRMTEDPEKLRHLKLWMKEFRGKH